MGEVKVSLSWIYFVESVDGAACLIHKKEEQNIKEIKTKEFYKKPLP